MKIEVYEVAFISFWTVIIVLLIMATVKDIKEVQLLNKDCTVKEGVFIKSERLCIKNNAIIDLKEYK